jgi:hypothetical protein
MSLGLMLKEHKQRKEGMHEGSKEGTNGIPTKLVKIR